MRLRHILHHACILYANLIYLSMLIGAASLVHAISTSLIHPYIQYTMYYTYCQHMSRDQLFCLYLEEVGPHLLLEKTEKTEFKLLKLFMKCSRLSRHHIIISLLHQPYMLSHQTFCSHAYS